MMNPNSKLFESLPRWLATYLAIALFVLIGPGISSAQDSFFNSSKKPLITDKNVAKADFQKTMLPPPELAPDLKLHVNPNGDSAPDNHELFASTPWLRDLQSQAAGVDFPKVFGSLALVLGGYFIFVWFSRQLTGMTGDTGLPREVVEVLGQTPFGPKKNLQLVRLGSKLLLLINSLEGTQSIGEITDPHEVEYLIGLCGGKRTSRSAVAIRKASTSNANNQSGGDLKRILMQLQSENGMKNNSVFEA